MIAAGSPGVSRSIRNTKIATIASTGMVASRRRATKASMGGAASGLVQSQASTPTGRPGHGEIVPAAMRARLLEHAVPYDERPMRGGRWDAVLFLQ